jgi:hypothetical protein
MGTDRDGSVNGVKVVDTIHNVCIPGSVPALAWNRDTVETSWDTSLKSLC